MTFRLSRYPALLLLAMALAGSYSTAGSACDNPVFRYALQNWAAADFELLLVQARDLTADEAAAWEALQRAASQTSPKPNLRLKVVPRAELEAAADPLYGPVLESTADNVLALISPSRPATARLAWFGPCNADAAKQIIDSPARRDLTERLLDGEAVVWIVLRSSEAETADALRATLETFLVSYSETVAAADAQAAAEAAARPQIPIAGQPAAPPVDKAEYWPPRFSTLELEVDDPDEKVLISMLQSLIDTPPAGEPLVFAVFGQGRVLGGMPAAQANLVSLRSACDFLTGACSCEVKDRNPGDDLLLSADWSSVAADSGSSGLISLLALEPEMAPETGSAAANETAETPAAPIAPAPEAAAPVDQTASEKDPPPIEISSSTSKPGDVSPPPVKRVAASDDAPADRVSTIDGKWSWIAIVAAAGVFLAGYLLLRQSA